MILCVLLHWKPLSRYPNSLLQYFSSFHQHKFQQILYHRTERIFLNKAFHKHV